MIPNNHYRVKPVVTRCASTKRKSCEAALVFIFQRNEVKDRFKGLHRTIHPRLRPAQCAHDVCLLLISAARYTSFPLWLMWSTLRRLQCYSFLTGTRCSTSQWCQIDEMEKKNPTNKQNKNKTIVRRKKMGWRGSCDLSWRDISDRNTLAAFDNSTCLTLTACPSFSSDQ